ncbi:MAG: choice-of-anchor D domain-containing protein, partial [Leptospirales bacterium]|nr:choice-of-anchor D domain-containing protein [Leptospirales bacterium]
GAKTATLSPAGITLNVTGAGTGVPVPEIKVYCGTEVSNAGSCSFGNVQTGNSSAKTVWVYNVGIGSMSLSSLPTLSGADAGQFSLNTTGINTTIPFNDGTSFTVTFSPTTTGAKSAVLTIPNDDADESPFTINLSGTGTAGPSPEINLLRTGASIGSGSTFDLGSRSSGTTPFTETIVVQNTGNATLTLTGPPYVTLSGADANQFSLGLGSMGGSIAAGGTTFFTVSFAPTSVGVKNATLTIANNDLDESSYTVQLTGTGRGAQPVIVVRGTNMIPAGGSYSFDTNPSCVTDISFQIWNYGSSTLNLSGTPRVRLVGVVDNVFAVVSQPVSSSIAPNGSTTFSMESCLLPFPTGGFYRDESAVVEIVSDDPDFPTFSFTVMSTFLC